MNLHDTLARASHVAETHGTLAVSNNRPIRAARLLRLAELLDEALLVLAEDAAIEAMVEELMQGAMA